MTDEPTAAPGDHAPEDDRIAELRALPAWNEPEAYRGSVGRTMFDTPGAKDNSVTVLLPTDAVQQVPAQALVRIDSQPDGRRYLGIVVAGPFAEPDGLRADTPAIVTTAVRGATFMPRYHGRVQVELIGEQLPSGTLVPPRLRPLPNSPVFVLPSAEKAAILHVEGSMLLGVAAGDEHIEVKIPGDRKSVLPRHTGVLGTTGGGKSTTVSRLIREAAADDYAVILLDTEGEYTQINEPTEDPTMLAALAQRGQRPEGTPRTRIYTLVGKETSNPDHGDVVPFTLRFNTMSPFVVEELLDLNEAQKQRFEKAYDTTKHVMQDLGVFPRPDHPDDKRVSIELDEFDTGYPRMRLAHLYDVIALIHAKVGKEDPAAVYLRSPEFRGADKKKVLDRVQSVTADHVMSWRALLGKVGRLMRLNVFDHADATPLDYDALLQPGRVSIFDLSDTDSPLLNNLVIADLLRGTQRRQDEHYQASQRPGGATLTKTVIIIEEAHEFLSEERITAMPNLFQQVARIAKRGRKRWLSLVFVTQLPQHLPRQVLGLVNNFVLHKISDATTISRLRSSIAGIDDALWQRLPGLAPGQAIVTFTSMTRPLLVAVDATPAKLRMVD
ncbi:ATP-binding protein [Geodermatophilus sp. URMC 63]